MVLIDIFYTAYIHHGWYRPAKHYED